MLILTIRVATFPLFMSLTMYFFFGILISFDDEYFIKKIITDDEKVDHKIKLQAFQRFQEKPNIKK